MAKFRSEARKRQYKKLVASARGIMGACGHEHSHMSDFAVVLHTMRATRRVAEAARQAGGSAQEAAIAFQSAAKAVSDWAIAIDRQTTVEF